jgi:hypothetical protein
MAGGTAPLGIIMIAAGGFIGFEALKHFQGTGNAQASSGSSSGNTGVSAGQQGAVNSSTTGNWITDAKAFAQANGIDPAAVIAIVQFESQGNPNATNPDCKGNGSYDTVCRGYLQVNESQYGPAPTDLASQLAISGIGDRIVNTARQYGSSWKSNFLAYWAAAQGGYSNGSVSDQQRAQQAVAYALQNAQ